MTSERAAVIAADWWVDLTAPQAAVLLGVLAIVALLLWMYGDG